MSQISPTRAEPGHHRSSPAVMNLRGLEHGLRQTVDGEVRFDAAPRWW